MAVGESWLERVAAEKTFREVEISAMAQKLLQRSPTNRIISAGNQATLLIVLRLQALRMKGKMSFKPSNDGLKPEVINSWKWLSDFADMVEDYQLTIGSPKNSRDQFLAALKREMKSDEDKKQGFFGR